MTARKNKPLDSGMSRCANTEWPPATKQTNTINFEHRQRHTGIACSTGALSHDGDSLRITAETGNVGLQPPQRGLSATTEISPQKRKSTAAHLLIVQAEVHGGLFGNE